MHPVKKIRAIAEQKKLILCLLCLNFFNGRLDRRVAVRCHLLDLAYGFQSTSYCFIHCVLKSLVYQFLMKWFLICRTVLYRKTLNSLRGFSLICSKEYVHKHGGVMWCDIISLGPTNMHCLGTCIVWGLVSQWWRAFSWRSGWTYRG